MLCSGTSPPPSPGLVPTSHISLGLSACWAIFNFCFTCILHWYDYPPRSLTIFTHFFLHPFYSALVIKVFPVNCRLNICWVLNFVSVLFFLFVLHFVFDMDYLPRSINTFCSNSLTLTISSCTGYQNLSYKFAGSIFNEASYSFLSLYFCFYTPNLPFLSCFQQPFSPTNSAFLPTTLFN